MRHKSNPEELLAKLKNELTFNTIFEEIGRKFPKEKRDRNSKFFKLHYRQNL